MPFFASVIDEFARSEWTAHQLEIAAMLARTHGQPATPTTLVLDAQGRIAARVSGATTETTVRNMVDKVLAEKA